VLQVTPGSAAGLSDLSRQSVAAACAGRHKLDMSAILLSAVLATLSGSAQDEELPPVTYPTLVATAPDAKGFVPKGWKLETQDSGDLDGDGLPDIALALHQQDPRNVIPNGPLCGDTLDTNPRILAVALAQRGGDYRLVMQNHSFVPRRDMPAPKTGSHPKVLLAARWG
jgi:hypothetical protein